MLPSDPALLHVSRKHGCSPSLCLAIWEDVNKLLPQAEKPKRYFRIVFRQGGKYGSFCRISDFFPSEDSIVLYARELTGDKGSVITLTIEEFKSKEDFEAYTA